MQRGTHLERCEIHAPSRFHSFLHICVVVQLTKIGGGGSP